MVQATLAGLNPWVTKESLIEAHGLTKRNKHLDFNQGNGVAYADEWMWWCESVSLSVDVDDHHITTTFLLSVPSLSR